jgi:putative proteasome-type protease
MTYCLSLLCHEGLVFVSDSRTSAGVDNINIRPKMRVYAEEGERVICLMTSGNLSLTQSVIALIEEDALLARTDPAHPHLLSHTTMFATARYVGSKVREVATMDRAALEADGFGFNINILVGGQIGISRTRFTTFIRRGTRSVRTWRDHSCRLANPNMASRSSTEDSPTRRNSWRR